MIRIAGLDPALRNWGWSTGLYDPRDQTLFIDTVGVIQPVIPEGKQVRVNSNDLLSAEQLMANCWEVVKDAQAVFVEVPVGSQSARSMASYGICVGVLGSLRARGIPFIELNPTEVKLVTGKKTATKQEMIDWATKRFPSANWPTQTKKGITTFVASSAEHMADACAAAQAGIDNQQFKQFMRYAQGTS